MSLNEISSLVRIASLKTVIPTAAANGFGKAGIVTLRHRHIFKDTDFAPGCSSGWRLRWLIPWIRWWHWRKFVYSDTPSEHTTEGFIDFNWKGHFSSSWIPKELGFSSTRKPNNSETIQRFTRCNSSTINNYNKERQKTTERESLATLLQVHTETNCAKLWVQRIIGHFRSNWVPKQFPKHRSEDEDAPKVQVWST